MNFIEEFKKGQLEKNKGLYMGEGLDNISKAINGIQRHRIYVIASPPKTGKCLAPQELVIMSDYSQKQAKDIVVGDTVLGIDGKPNKVINTTMGQSEMYKIHQSNAEDYIVNDAHLLSIKDRQGNIRHIKAKDFNKQSFDQKRTNSYGYKHCVPMPEREVKIDPYYLGIWLSDGHSVETNTVTNPDKEVIEYLQRYADKLDMSCKTYSNIKTRLVDNTSPCYQVDNQPFRNAEDASKIIGISPSHFNYLLRKGVNNYNNHTFKRVKNGVSNTLIDNMRAYGLEGNKHIPDDFLYNSEENRLKLLAGILDGDGHLRKKQKVTFEIIQKSEKLIQQIKFLSDSLGLNTYLTTKQGTLKRKDGTIYESTVYRLIISGDTFRIPTLIERKQVKKKCRLSNSVLKVESIGIGDYYGFSLENEDKRFFLKDFTVTHNSTYLNYGFIISPYLDWLEKGEDKEIEWVYFSFEIDRVSAEFDFATYFLYHDFGIESIALTEEQPLTIRGKKQTSIPLSPDYLRGRILDDNNKVIKVKESIEKALKEVYTNRIVPLFGEYSKSGKILKKGLIDFVEKRDNPTGLWKYLLRKAETEGKFIYEYYDKDKKRLRGYQPNNPNKVTIVVLDHIRKCLPERGYNLKQTVDKMSEMIVDMRNLLSYTFAIVVHTNRSIADPDRLKFAKDELYIQPEDIKDSGNLSEDADYVFTMLNPNDEKYHLNKHFGMALKDGNGNPLYPYLRTLHLVESRHCFYPQHFRTIMQGNLKTFKQFNNQQQHDKN